MVGGLDSSDGGWLLVGVGGGGDRFVFERWGLGVVGVVTCVMTAMGCTSSMLLPPINTTWRGRRLVSSGVVTVC